MQVRVNGVAPSLPPEWRDESLLVRRPKLPPGHDGQVDLPSHQWVGASPVTCQAPSG